ncbi:MAG: TrkA family potassium uptake protein [Oscillospiraceae bacterium]|jgi:trk system potassium uptake protein TrkA|nr:TrkA family potassium uptake protein [Oscillospiraceae bacterium]MCI1990208.1 TrkA family potassium uptake protein [Oscillospiraceae bacterium]MCI2035920.1 TrkA family potassium uptake protein [Oscillospiraceae bacterium]
MKIVVVGCGRNGSGLAVALSKKGHSVTVIDSDAAAFAQLGKDFRGKTVQGVGFDRDILQKAEIDRTDALAAFTSSDESNAVIARMAREIYHVPKVVARLYDRRKAEIYKRLGIQTLSSTTWGIKRAVDILSYSPLDSVFTFGNGDVELVKIEVPSMIAGRKVNDLTVPGDIHVTAVERANRTILPSAGTVFQRGDILYIAASIAAGNQLKKLLGLSGGEGM